MHDVFDRFSLKNQVAVITGAGRGIGEGIAMDFARAGAKVALAARRTHEIEAVAERIIQEGGEAIAVTTDVTDPDALEALAVATKAAFGKLTIWVNNAGGSTKRQPMTTLPRDEWHRTIAVNAVATAAPLHHEVPANTARVTVHAEDSFVQMTKKHALRKSCQPIGLHC